jgi:hypothetical protein
MDFTTMKTQRKAAHQRRDLIKSLNVEFALSIRLVIFIPSGGKVIIVDGWYSRDEFCGSEASSCDRWGYSGETSGGGGE